MSFTVYKSSAGSGKTFTLVKEFLALVLVNPETYRNILAITFTNKAANEMKERIVQSLLQLAAPVSSWPAYSHSMVNEIMVNHGLSAEQIRSRAASVLKRILHNYTDLSVSTIDSFMQRVIRTFSIDLDLPHQYEIEMDIELLRIRAVDRLIDRVGHDWDITSFLVRYIEAKTDEDKSWRIEKDLNDIAKSLYREDGLASRALLLNATYDDFVDANSRIRTWMTGFEDQLKETGTTALRLIDSQGLGIEDFSNREKGIGGFFQKLVNGDIEGAAKPNKYVSNAIENDVWSAAKQSSNVKAGIETIKSQLAVCYQQAKLHLDQDVGRYNLYRLLLRNLYPTAVLTSIEKMIFEIREEEQILPISDFNRIVSQVTLTEPAPYIYEKLGVRFKHYMIDEFQDTSVLQWANLLPLVENSLASKYFNLVVGDGKQAIYRWRNGEVEQFISLPKLRHYLSPHDVLREAALERNFVQRNLEINYRSHKTIIGFNNSLFTYLSAILSDDLAMVYAEVKQQVLPDKANGYVQVEFTGPTKGEEHLHCDRILQLVHTLLDDGYMPGNIAVLCRRNVECSLVARYLLENQIPVVSSDSLLLGSSQKVRLLMACLRIAVNPNDQPAYVEAINLLVNLGFLHECTLRDALVQVFAPQQADTNSLVSVRQKFLRLLSDHGMNTRFDELAKLPLYEMLEELIRLFGFHKTEDIYIQFFAGELHSKALKNMLLPDNLVSWWEEKGCTISVIFPETMHAVQVMTIHKSKGLQFPVVIFPFANAAVNIQRAYAWVDLDDPLSGNVKAAYLPLASLGNTPFEQLKTDETNKVLLDLVNLMYVAFTRPEERLYVLSELKNNVPGKELSIPAFLYQFIKKEMPEFGGEFYSVGTPVPRKRPVLAMDDKVEVLVNELHNEPISWRERLVLGSRATESWIADEAGVERQFGTIIHSLLAKIKNLDDINDALRAMITNGEITADIVEPVSDLVRFIKSHPAVCSVFQISGHAFPEPEILLPDGNVFRPDRLIIDEDSCLVVEFKTGMKKPEHPQQLSKYLRLLKQMGYSKVKGRLIYLGATDCLAEDIES